MDNLTLIMVNIFSYRKIVFIVLFFGYTVFFWAIKEIPPTRLEVYFLNVDQGDSIFIRTPSSNQILIDGGPKSNVLNELSKVMPFFNKSIDLVVLTHPHDDHVQGLIEVLKRYEVKAVLLTGVSFSNPNYDEFLRLTNEKEIPIFIADKDSDFSFDDVYFDVLYPLKSLSGKTVKNINNSSIATRLLYEDYEIYLGGDGENEVEQEILKSGQVINSVIYKASHHGSRTASSSEFLAKIKPQIAVIQCGVDNKFSHPHPETIRNSNRAKVQRTYRTDMDGWVEISF